MTFLGRWIIAEAFGFILFPVAFTLWQPNLKYDLLVSMIVMLFVQFLTWLWLIPFLGGTALAVGWQVYAEWKAA